MKKMKELCFAAVSTLGFVMFVNADSVTLNGYTWQYSLSEEGATITSESSFTCAVSPRPDGELTIPSELGGCSVVGIGSYAFYGCGGLTKVTIPDSVNNIGSYAFSHCKNLRSLTMSENVEKIGAAAFLDCSSITNIRISTSIADISDSMFWGCSSLTNVMIPEGVTRIGNASFFGCSSLVNVTIPESVKTIGNMAFGECNALTRAVIPDGVTKIGNHAFGGCCSLIGTLPDGEYDVDISTVEGQPFGQEVAQDSISFLAVISKAAGRKFFTPLATVGTDIKFANGLHGLSILSATLFDYLDHNDVPLSLAWPCVERVPMIAAVEPSFSFNIPAVQASSTADDTTTWMFNPTDWLRAGMLAAVYTFPFRRNGNERNNSFKAQAIMRIILAPEGINLRASDGLGNVLRPQTAAEWTQKMDMFKLSGVNNVFCLTFKLNEQTITLPNNIDNEEQAGGMINFPVNVAAINNAGPVPLVTKKTVKNTSNGVTTTTEEYTVNVSPLGKDGKPLFPVVGSPIDKVAFNAIASQTLVPYVCVWVRIVNGDGKTVDLVPAVIEDDQALNSGNSQLPVLSEYLLQRRDGPLLRFQGKNSFFSYSTMVAGSAPAGGEVQWEPTAFCALDPRFNWAPEDWYDPGASVTSFQAWLAKTKDFLRVHADECDSDIFFAVSNQGVLQSLGEFSFLPLLTDIYGGGAPLLTVRGASGGYDGVVRTDPASIANRRSAWHSCEMNSEMYNYFNIWGIGRSRPRDGYANSLSLEGDLFMATIVNPPTDYWAAGLMLDDENELRQILGDETLPYIYGIEAQNYTFNGCNTQAQITDVELGKIAGMIRNGFRDVRKIDSAIEDVFPILSLKGFAEIWDSLDWMPNKTNPNFKSFLGLSLGEPLYGVDRKFLKSYWHDCFDDVMFSTYSGVIFSQDRSTLILIPSVSSKVSIPSSVVNIDQYAFRECSNLNVVYFHGNAPSGERDIYLGTSEMLITYVPVGSEGWREEGSEVLPENGHYLRPMVG